MDDWVSCIYGVFFFCFFCLGSFFWWVCFWCFVLFGIYDMFFWIYVGYYYGSGEFWILKGSFILGYVYCVDVFLGVCFICICWWWVIFFRLFDFELRSSLELFWVVYVGIIGECVVIRSWILLWVYVGFLRGRGGDYGNFVY